MQLCALFQDGLKLELNCVTIHLKINIKDKPNCT